MDNKPTITGVGRYKLKYRGTDCLNCGHPLDMSDKYCPNCSQANSTKKLTLKDFFDEFFSNLLSYDSKLLQTLSALIIRPGVITKDFIEGKRVSYTNPFRFLLSLAFVYFLMLSFSGDYEKLNSYGYKNDGDAIKETSLNIKNPKDQQQVYMALDSLNVLISDSQKDSTLLADPEKYFHDLKQDGSIRFLKMEFFYKLIKKEWIHDFEGTKEKYNIEDTFENKAAFAVSFSIFKVSQQPGSFATDLISKLPILIFFFLPVFTLFIWLAYIRKKYNYTDHLIFSFHNQSLLFILLIISFIVDAIFEVNSSGIFLFIFSIYLFIAMWKFYGQGIIKTGIKYIYLNTVFFILAFFIGLTSLIVSAITY